MDIKQRSVKFTPGLYLSYVAGGEAIAWATGGMEAARLAQFCRDLATEPEFNRAVELAKAAWWQSIADAVANGTREVV